MTGDELTDAWDAGVLFPGGIGHVKHLRIAWVLPKHHGPTKAKARLIGGTKRACHVHGCPEKFGAALTERWRTRSRMRSTAESSKRTPTSSSLRTPSYDAEIFSASPTESIAFKPEAPRRPIGLV